MSSPEQQGPPYLPKTAGVGGRPTVGTDVPVLAVLLAFYIGGAVANMTIFQLNRRKGIKFIPSAAMFGFCMSRIATCTLRIGWATRPDNIRLAIAAQIFTAAGILIVYVILLLLALRVLRATQPRLGWNRILSITTKISYLGVFIALALVISFTVTSFYTLSLHLRHIAMWMQRGSILYLLIFNLAPTVILFLTLLLPRASGAENFGTGSIASKQAILGVALFFSNFIAGFRCGTAWATPRPATDPAWFDSKPAFYVIELAFEIVIIYLLIITRFDRRFWVPNGSKKQGDYYELDSRAGKEEIVES